MNAARDLLDDLAMIGATVEPAGDRLILRAGPIAIPAALVNRLRKAKPDLIATLAGNSAGEDPEHAARPQFRHRTLEARIVEWLNEHLAPSAPGRCAWCARPESPERRGAPVRDRARDAYMATRRMLGSLARGPPRSSCQSADADGRFPT